MADTDIFGLVSLLLAVGGAVYLFRARKAEREADAAAAVIERAAPNARNARTVPPKLLASEPRVTAPRAAPAPVVRIDPAPRSKRVSATAATVLDLPVVPDPPPAPSPQRAKPGPAPERAKPAPPDRAKPAPVEDEVPVLSYEEDEDVEPTKLTRADEQEIRPPVERIVFDEGADQDVGEDGPLLVVYALAQTDTGRRRKQNEDSYLISDQHGVFVVADGMGGHRGGQQASRLAVETMNVAFTSQYFAAEAHPDLPIAASELARAIQMSNTAILDEAAARVELTGMGTTLCAARFTDGARRLYLGHVGDSRCYRMRDGVMRMMTTDHTMAEYGVTGPEGAQLSRALGVWPTIPIDIVMAAPCLGDVYLLCSDGLTKMLPDETIAAQLLHEEDPKAVVERLVMFANAHGGKDNITVILLRVVAPGWTPPVRPSAPAPIEE